MKKIKITIGINKKKKIYLINIDNNIKNHINNIHNDKEKFSYKNKYEDYPELLCDIKNIMKMQLLKKIKRKKKNLLNLEIVHIIKMNY